jgi:dihydropyrimidinase
MAVMFDAFRARGGAEAFVRACCTRPAQLHGLPGKGAIAEGFDADLVIWDEAREVTFGENDLADNVGYNPWVGRTVRGWPETVIRRGAVVAEGGELRAEPGSGRFIARDAFWLSGTAPAAEAAEVLS